MAANCPCRYATLRRDVSMAVFARQRTTPRPRWGSPHCPGELERDGCRCQHDAGNGARMQPQGGIDAGVLALAGHLCSEVERGGMPVDVDLPQEHGLFINVLATYPCSAVPRP